MIALIQRVTHARVTVDGTTIGEINGGILAFIGVEKGDTLTHVAQLSKKMLSYRIFADEAQKMNLSVKDIQGDVLLVSQFTLAADTHSGTRAGLSAAAPPEVARELFDAYVAQVRTEARLHHVATGQFGADMHVALVNDGPVTFYLSV